MSITQRELAKELNLSPATISKVFRNAHDIGHATRSRVLSEAARRGYKAPLSLSATRVQRGGRKQNRKFAGVFYHANNKNLQQTDVLYLDGLSEAAQDMGVSLIVHRIEDDGSDLLLPSNQPVAMRDGLLNGIILIHCFDEHVVQNLAEAMPIVTITHWVPDAKCDHIDSDHIGGVQRLVQHLKDLNHRRIGYMARRVNSSFELSRYASFHRAMTHERLDVLPDATIVNRKDRLDPSDAAKVIADQLHSDVTAWVCSTGAYAYQIMTELERMGVDVPGQVSIVGFDDNDLTRHNDTQRQLTTVGTPFRTMGYVSLVRLFQRAENPNFPPMQVLLDCPLVVGDTTGPAPSAK